jgi:hypothetical protein
MFATVRTVSNNPNTLAQFNTIQAAIDASFSGDTVYVHGSSTPYGGFNLTDKRLTIIGPGWSPVQNFMPFKATINSAVNIAGPGCKNSEIQGLYFQLTVSINTTRPDSLRFIRNQFGSAIYFFQAALFSGYVFQGNWFDGSWLSAGAGVSFQNFLFQNNIFYSTSTNGSLYGFLTCTNVLLDHNLWYGPSTGSSICFGSSCSHLTLTNNIFVHRDAATNNTLSTFNNNITFNAGVNNPWAVNGNLGDASNIAGQDPQMVSQVQVNNGADDPLLDFTIAAGPANNTGSDTKDMGLLYDPSGSLNWANCRMSRLPFIYSMYINNPTIAAGGTLTVQVEARKNN